ncbi:MAG TPA: BTAD domain-containing putative transcriptional regulator [Intrasporangium sp.]|uniref:AfsR/SARP family transcriptional regulator n=1 Tax=Intrasporangium sp. TaxID=1925024 RepID=UPI002D771ADB|nr:BTAD domain-containing putative transcriptional regulator [Intrasporangium sp.]HET7397288.1 BTAD domain-containing putative transcriptional regulator [Intrasporangium sp.]
MDSDVADRTRPPAPWSLRLLDGWRLDHLGAAALVSQREQRVLSLLAMRGERTRSYVAGALWPESSEARAQGNLRASVWHLQHLTDGVVEVNGTMRLSASVEVDLHALRAVIRDLAAPTTAVDVGHALGLLCYDDLLPGWSDEWVEEERALLHPPRMRSLEDLTERLLDRHDLAGALDAAMRAVRIDPLRERAQRALIRVHLEDGNNVEAMRVYHAFRHTLYRELGVTVSDQLLDLVRPLQACSATNPLMGQSR